jgi:hypothetical protein
VATLLFVYAKNVLDLSSAVTAGLVVAAGLTELAGLMLGRLLADRLGRRPTAGLALVLMVGAGVLTYSGSVPALAVGYLSGVLVGATYGRPAIALTAELFPSPSSRRWPARSWSPACWDRPRPVAGRHHRGRARQLRWGRWRRCASPPDWRRCCSHTSPRPGGSSWSGRRPTSRIAASSRRDASQRAEARVPLYWLLSGESDCGTLMLTLAIGGDADAESPPAAPHAEPIEADGKGLVGTI